MVGKRYDIDAEAIDRSEGAKRDVIAGGIVVPRSFCCGARAENVMQATVRALIGIGGGPDRALATALILNVALILFGWRRYKDLNREILERTEAEQRARYLADTDPLTGFLNRRALLATGQRQIANAIADKRHVALFLLDLDHFKTVNDIHGHVAGDRVLQVAADSISAVLPPNATKARSAAMIRAMWCSNPRRAPISTRWPPNSSRRWKIR